MIVLIPLHGFVTWNGGVDLIRLIVTGLRTVAAARSVTLVFAMPAPATNISAAERGLRSMMGEVVSGLRVFECEDSARGINRAAVEAGANIVFPSMLPIRTNHVKKVGYLYDFQHRDIPEFFSDDERARRDEHFVDMVERSDAMFVTSRSVAGHTQRMLGVPEQRILVMPFTAYANADWFALDNAAARQKYAVDARYLMICNHFWMHKDHATALRAFAQLVAMPKHADLQLVMTGETSDFRDPKHFASILALIETLGIADRCRIVGLIPKHDQIALLRGAALLLQPTRYEGGPGGGSLYEALGLGLPAVVSDIDVNLEAASDGVTYFRFGDVDDLLHQLQVVLDTPRSAADSTELLDRAQQRLEHMGHTILDFLQAMAR